MGTITQRSVRRSLEKRGLIPVKPPRVMPNYTKRDPFNGHLYEHSLHPTKGWRITRVIGR